MTRTRKLAGMLLLLAAACSSAAGPSGPEDDLEANRRTWRAKGYRSYEYRFQRTCFCPPDVTAPVLIAVRNGAISSVTSEQTGAALDRSSYDRYLTVEQAFETIERAIRDGAATVRVRYDATLGYPAEVWIDVSEQLADEEISFELGRLQPLR